MYFSCDVGKQMDRTNGTLDLDNYDYEALMGVSLDMDKRDRILSHASASTHAMTLVGVDIDANGKPNLMADREQLGAGRPTTVICSLPTTGWTNTCSAWWWSANICPKQP